MQMLTEQRTVDMRWMTPLDFMEILNVQLHSTFDSVYYDVDRLTEREVKKAHWLYQLIEEAQKIREGDLLVVTPSSQTEEAIVSVRHVRDPAELVQWSDNGKIVVTVPGVGSSSFGTAAFARTVADGLSASTIGLVTGAGWVDLAYEVMLGWAGFAGGKCAARSASSAFSTGFGHAWMLQGLLPGPVPAVLAPANRAMLAFVIEEHTQALKRLLLALDRVDYLIGHSKGNGILISALKIPEVAAKYRGNDKLRVITFGCVVTPPDWLKPPNWLAESVGKQPRCWSDITDDELTTISTSGAQIIQFLGASDGLGAQNSDLRNPYISIEDAGHRLVSKETPHRAIDHPYGAMKFMRTVFDHEMFDISWLFGKPTQAVDPIAILRRLRGKADRIYVAAASRHAA